MLQGLFRAILLLGCAVGLWSSAAVDTGVPAAIVSLMASAQASEVASERSPPLGMVIQERPGGGRVLEKDYGVTVGTGPNGGSQTKVRVHENKSGEIHGHPAGPEKF